VSGANTGEGPSVGVGVLVRRDRVVLLGHRRGAHGAGSWAPPGGHLDRGEDVDDCARRECLEETGLSLTATRPGPWTNDIFQAEGRHYVTVWVVGTAAAGEPRVMEPDKCERWEWHPWDRLPEPLFLPLVHLRAKGFDPWA
jgi:8-oxo-dGTP diphosphatase